MLPAAFTGAAGRLVLSLVAAVFAADGTVIGAVLGLLSGFIHDDGLVQGMLVGAITGALVSVELPHSLVRTWSYVDCSMDGWIKRTLFGLRSLPAGRSVFATISSALDDQIDALQRHAGQGERSGELFEPSSPVMAARRAAVDSLPVTEVSQFTNETARQQTTCPICLHDFQAGESARMLPACCHVFHLACIDSWLMWKSQCPMCRHTMY